MMKKVVAIFILICYTIGGTFAVEQKMPNGVIGYWTTNTSNDDNIVASWIWLSNKSDVESMFARRKFILDNTPQKAIIRIAATDLYQLYVNGKYMCQGPARSAPHHQSYDVLDITSLLHRGENIIAVRTLFKAGARSYNHLCRAGLLVQLDCDGKNAIIKSDSSWVVRSDESWQNSLSMNRFQRVENDVVNLKKYDYGWNYLEYDDSKWSFAYELMREVGWPSVQSNAVSQPLTPPWMTLTKRDIPYLNEEVIHVNNIIASSCIDYDLDKTSIKYKLNGVIDKAVISGIDGYKVGDGAITISPQSKSNSCIVVFDLGKMYSGMGQLRIKGGEGTVVDIHYAPFIVDGVFTSNIVDSKYCDRVILSGNSDVWQAANFKPTRYMAICISNSSSNVDIDFVGLRQLSFPFERKGYIKSSDAPWVEQYMEATARTIEACTTDALTDNYRERRQYAQTGYYGALGSYYLFGDYTLQRRYLIQIAQEQYANGIMPAYAPLASDDYMIILDSNCLWIRSLYNYYLYSGDSSILEILIPSAKRLMELLHKYTDQDGLIKNPPYAYWLDHAKIDRQGANLTLNFHYLGALNDFVEILKWTNDDDVNIYTERANKLDESINTLFWDSDKGLFVDAYIDGELSEEVSEHANAAALCVVSDERTKSVAQKLLADDNHNYIYRESGVLMVTPAMSYFLHKGLCMQGKTPESLAMMRARFDKMLNSDSNQTLWEEWWLDAIGRSGKLQKGRTRSDAQTESAFAPALFAEYIVGFKPIDVGMRTVELSYPISGVMNVEASIPSIYGDIKIEWMRPQSVGGKLKLSIPNGVVMNLKLDSFKSKSKSIIINAQKYNREEYIEEFGAGEYEIKF